MERRGSSAVIWQRRNSREGLGGQAKRYVTFVSTNADLDQNAISSGASDGAESMRRPSVFAPSETSRRPSIFAPSETSRRPSIFAPSETSDRRPSIFNNDYTARQEKTARRPSTIHIRRFTDEDIVSPPGASETYGISPTDSVFTRRRPSQFDRSLVPSGLALNKRRPSQFTPVTAIPQTISPISEIPPALSRNVQHKTKSHKQRQDRRSNSTDGTSSEDFPLQDIPKTKTQSQLTVTVNAIDPVSQERDNDYGIGVSPWSGNNPWNFSQPSHSAEPSPASAGRKPSWFHVPSYVNRAWQEEKQAWKGMEHLPANADSDDRRPSQSSATKRLSNRLSHLYKSDPTPQDVDKQTGSSGNRLSGSMFGGFSFAQSDLNSRKGDFKDERGPSYDDIAPFQATQQNFKFQADSMQYDETKKAPSFVQPLSDQYFVSRRTGMAPVPKPWMNAKDPRRKWATLFPILGLFVGFCLAALLVWQGLGTIETHQYCLVLDDEFGGKELNTSIWTKEAQVDGYGNGQFEETTVTGENVFLNDGVLWIKPTLQDAHLVETTGSVINLTANGVCTGTTWAECFTSTNTTNGTIVNPVKSGRINTRKAASIQYGRVEVVAKLPKGDWLWPAIWMMPVNDTYGAWPLSGEIDIAESRGNNHSYVLGGNNLISSTLHWGPNQLTDAWWMTYRKRALARGTYSDKFHTFGLEWSERYLYTYLDSRLAQVLYVKFNEPMWQRGNFPLADSNGTAYVNPWTVTGHDSTPFDQPFYLILNVAVGGDNGWFKDGADGKPWVDKSPNEKLEFWNARDQWYPTWEGGGQMEVQSVKMWQQKGFKGC